MEVNFVVDWDPLKKVLRERECSGFMFMGSVMLQDKRKIYLYKHIITRNYLNIDSEGKFYRYIHSINSYRPVSKEEALSPFTRDNVMLSTL